MKDEEYTDLVILVGEMFLNGTSSLVSEYPDAELYDGKKYAITLAVNAFLLHKETTKVIHNYGFANEEVIWQSK